MGFRDISIEEYQQLAETEGPDAADCLHYFMTVEKYLPNGTEEKRLPSDMMKKIAEELNVTPTRLIARRHRWMKNGTWDKTASVFREIKLQQIFIATQYVLGQYPQMLMDIANIAADSTEKTRDRLAAFKLLSELVVKPALTETSKNVDAETEYIQQRGQTAE